jgi:hypothetical protein
MVEQDALIQFWELTTTGLAEVVDQVGQDRPVQVESVVAVVVAITPAQEVPVVLDITQEPLELTLVVQVERTLAGVAVRELTATTPVLKVAQALSSFVT